jgi:hypothetical protein
VEVENVQFFGAPHADVKSADKYLIIRLHQSFPIPKKSGGGRGGKCFYFEECIKYCEESRGTVISYIQ